MKKSALVLGCALACLAVPGKAQAASITFIFDYHIGATGLTGPSGPWGSVTISDSVIDPNRVDIALTLTPPAGFTGLDLFYLNLDLQPDIPPIGTDPDFLVKTLNYLVPTTNAAGNIGGTLGTVGYSDGTSQFAVNGFLFDLTPNPTSTALTFTGSWALYIDNTSPLADTPVNLDVNMFLTPSAFTATGGQTIPMFAGYSTTPSSAGGPVFRAFASSTAVPEPGTLSLLGLGMLGLARARLRRRRS
jgi:hypothetical protein